MRTLASLSCVALLSGVAFGQAPGTQAAETTPKFEAADVHVSPHGANLYMTGEVLRGGRYDIKNGTMVDLIRTAYGMDADRVIGGPSWLELDRFDVTAKGRQGRPRIRSN